MQLDAPDEAEETTPEEQTAPAAPAWLLAALAVAALLIFFWGLGNIPLLSFNEARRGVPVQEMLTSGNWLVPTLNGELYISKPPLLYWLAALPALISGHMSEWAIRLPSALAASALTLLTFVILRRRLGLQVAIFAVLVLITSAGFTAFARRAEIEMLLAACCGISMLAAFEYIFGEQRKYWLDIAFAALGLALLSKGPVALLFYFPLLLAYWAKTRDANALACITYWRGWLLALLIALPWYAMVSLELGWDIWGKVVETDIAGKVGTAQTDPLYQYPLWLLADFLPWCLLALFTPKKSWRLWLEKPQHVFLLIAALLPLVVFTAFANKHAKYLLPSYIAWAGLLAIVTGDAYDKLRTRGRQWLHGGIVVLLLGFLVYYAIGETRLLKHRHQALPEIAATMAKYPHVPVYAWHDIDPRVVFYRGMPIQPIRSRELDDHRLAKEDFLLFVEGNIPAEASDMCKIKTFKPYLKRDRKATLFGNGAVCE